MQILDEVKKWMSFWGWQNGGNPGDVKHDADGKVIARHGDATWIEDVQTSLEKQERQAAIAELERRAAQR